MIRKWLADTIIKPAVRFYLKKERPFHYGSLKLRIAPGVFHPRFFFSSLFLAEFTETLDLNGKDVCEPCTGSALTAFIAIRKGAEVVCYDINPVAVEAIKKNARENLSGEEQNRFRFFLSDGFQAIPSQTYDVILINPPYFFAKVEQDEQLAWNCGENGEFFITFFAALQSRLKARGVCYMVLAENCDIERIRFMALQHRLSFHLIHTKKIRWEENYIFEIKCA